MITTHYGLLISQTSELDSALDQEIFPNLADETVVTANKSYGVLTGASIGRISIWRYHDEVTATSEAGHSSIFWDGTLSSMDGS